MPQVRESFLSPFHPAVPSEKPNAISVYAEASRLLAASLIPGATYPTCLPVHFFLASPQTAGQVSGCALAGILAFTLLCKLKIAAAVGFSVSGDCTEHVGPHSSQGHSLVVT